MKMRDPVSDNHTDTPLFFVYILECSDKTLYTGWTNNIERRVREHNHGKTGARYTRSRRPVKAVYVEIYSTLSGALKREARIKKLSRIQKLQLIKCSVHPL
jgi:putative endonuclease